MKKIVEFHGYTLDVIAEAREGRRNNYSVAAVFVDKPSAHLPYQAIVNATTASQAIEKSLPSIEVVAGKRYHNKYKGAR